MEFSEDPTLLESVLRVSPLDDVERAWAFAVFCGLVESEAHDDFVRAVNECTRDTLADALLDFATRRAEVVDRRGVLATRLWQYFEVGQTLQPEPDTNPGAEPVG